MTQYIQYNLPGMDEQLARIQSREIDQECGQMHLARWFCRFSKYQKWCKDKKFQQRCSLAKLKGQDFEKWCEEERMRLCELMGNVGR